MPCTLAGAIPVIALTTPNPTTDIIAASNAHIAATSKSTFSVTGTIASLCLTRKSKTGPAAVTTLSKAALTRSHATFIKSIALTTTSMAMVIGSSQLLGKAAKMDVFIDSPAVFASAEPGSAAQKFLNLSTTPVLIAIQIPLNTVFIFSIGATSKPAIVCAVLGRKPNWVRIP